MWKKITAAMAAIGVMLTSTAFAADGLITSASFLGGENTLNPLANETLNITVVLSEEGYVAVDVKDLQDNSIFDNYSSGVTSNSIFTFSYDGTDSTGTVLSDGSYNLLINATSADGQTLDDASLIFEIASSTASDYTASDCGDADATSVIIQNVCATPNPWDPSDDELDIEWELETDVEEFTVFAYEVNGNDSVELMDDEELDDGDYDDDYLDWDGRDDDDEYIEEGLWELRFVAVTETGIDTVSFFVDVKYEEPAVLDDMFVTKDNFDNTIGEEVSLVFRVDTDSIVSVEVVDSSNDEVVELWDEVEIEKKDWYPVKWDGMDDDNDEVDEGNYKFVVTVQNVVNDDIEAVYTSETVEVEEDEVSSNRPNVTNDTMKPIILSKSGEDVSIRYEIDEDAEVTVEIFKGSKTSSAEIVLVDEKNKDKGSHSVTWNGLDEDGKSLDKNEVYSYRVTAKDPGSSHKTDKERGYFVIGNAGTDVSDDDDDDDNDDDDDDDVNVECDDDLFRDVSANSPYCESITWAEGKGIVNGYKDNTFRPYEYINRVEALKMVQEAFEMDILPVYYGQDLGFTDVEFGWYTKYLRTGIAYGMVNGYEGTTLVKPDEEINRVEVLKFALEAAEVSSGYTVPACNAAYYYDTEEGWYEDYVCASHDYELFNTAQGYFYPGNKVRRGEVVELLYRLVDAGLL